MTIATKGVMYIATGDRYVKSAIRSALTVEKNNPGLAIHLFTDQTSMDTTFMNVLFPFSSINIIENPYPRSKVDFMSRTPFDQTLFLDADTAINADIRGIFRILERFDIAMAHAMHRGPNRLQSIKLQLPSAFPEFNTGVVLYRKNGTVMKCLSEWEEFYKEEGMEKANDQTTLRELLWSSDLRIATLPPEYNVRFLKYHFLWSKSEAQIKIFHLKQFHHGWLSWIYKTSRFKRVIRIINPVRRFKNFKDKDKKIP